MIGVSRAWGSLTTRIGRVRDLGVWHGLCLLLLPGCPYWVPLEFAPANEPPEFQSVNPSPDSPVAVSGTTRFFVVVQDAEVDDVTFLWFVGGELLGTATPVITGQEDDGVYASELSLPHDARYDGQTLSCEAYDGQSEPVRVQWTLEVL